MIAGRWFKFVSPVFSTAFCATENDLKIMSIAFVSYVYCLTSSVGTIIMVFVDYK